MIPTAEHGVGVRFSRGNAQRWCRTAYDLTATLAKDRRRRSETELTEGMAALDALLLPLALTVARLSARTQVAEAAR